jgi:NADPH:quinone reductase-like Zn-dependent oxidoreductase
MGVAQSVSISSKLRLSCYISKPFYFPFKIRCNSYCRLPFKLGYDVSGTVVAVGLEVPSHIHPGVEVYSRVPEKNRGTFSEYAVSPASATALKPASLSHIQAASLPLAALTALQAFDAADMHLEGGLNGKTVYVPGGLSGTGSIGVQLAKNVFGAAKVITTLSPAKIAKADALLGSGVLDQIIDYTKDDPSSEIPVGSVDFYFDTMGSSVSRSLPLMKEGGIITPIIGFAFGPDLKRKAPHIPTFIVWILNFIGAIFQWRASRYGVELRPHFMEESAKDLDRLTGWIEKGKIKTIVGRVTKFEDIDAVREGCWEVYNGKGGTGKFVVEI